MKRFITGLVIGVLVGTAVPVGAQGAHRLVPCSELNALSQGSAERFLLGMLVIVVYFEDRGLLRPTSYGPMRGQLFGTIVGAIRGQCRTVPTQAVEDVLAELMGYSP